MSRNVLLKYIDLDNMSEGIFHPAYDYSITLPLHLL